MRATTVLGALVLLCLADTAFSLRVLLTYYPGGTSHRFIMQKMARELVSRGHEVDMLFMRADTEFKHSRVSETSYTPIFWDGYTSEEFAAAMVELSSVPETEPLKGLELIIKLSTTTCERLIVNNTQVLEQLKNRHYDIGFGDLSWDCSAILLPQILKIESIFFWPVGLYEPYLYYLGIETNAAYIPTFGTQYTPDMLRSSLAARLGNTINKLIAVFLCETYFLPAYLETRKIAGVPLEFAQRHNMLFVAGLWGYDPPREMSPNRFLSGPILPEPGKPLPADVSALLDTHKRNIYVSFGTVAVLPDAANRRLFDALSRLKDTRVLWRVDPLRQTGGLPPFSEWPAHMTHSDWFPQNDLMADDRLTLFVGHGGVNSVQELLYHGVRFINIPLLSDQADNTRRAVTVPGTGRWLDKSTFTTEEAVETIEAVMANDEMLRKAKAFARYTQSLNGLKAMADQLEYVAEFGQDHLVQPSLTDMPWYSRYNVDVVLVLLGVPVAVLLLLGVCICRCCCGKKRGGAKQKAQ